MNTIFTKSAAIIVCLSLIFSFYSCSGDIEESFDNNVLNTKTAVATDNSAVEMLNVAYGEHPQQVMDIYLLENRTLETPLVVLIHGGAWVAGDKADAGFMKDACYNNGMNVVNINYRLADSTINYTHIMEDISSAMAMILNHAAEYNVRTSKIVFWGGSAGGHLALLYAYNYDAQNAVSLIMTLGAPTALDDKITISLIPGLDKKIEAIGLLGVIVGKPYDILYPLDPAYIDTSPLHGRNLKPTLLIHGMSDSIVPLRQAWLMRDKLEQKNINYRLFEIPGGAHDGSGGWPGYAEEAQRIMYEWVINYSN